MISGEPIPVDKAPGSAVVGGSVNGRGSLVLVLSTGELDRGAPHEIAIRAMQPGDPLDGQALFRRTFVVRP